MATPSTVRDGTAAAKGSSDEHLKIRSEALVAKVKKLLHEGNVQRIIVKSNEGHTIMEIPVTAGLVAVVLAPVLSAVAAVGALASHWQIEIQRSTRS